MPRPRLLAVGPVRSGRRHLPESRLRLQWPAFAFFCVYAYRRFVRLEAEEQEAESTGGRRPSEPDEPTEIPEDLLPTRPRTLAEAREQEAADPDAQQINEYNEYLAQLARRSDRSAQ